MYVYKIFRRYVYLILHIFFFVVAGELHVFNMETFLWIFLFIFRLFMFFAAYKMFINI